MFFVLELVNLAVQSIALATGINMYAVDHYFYPDEMESAIHVEAVRDWMRSDGRGKCVYHGAMVPYSQDWEEIDDSSGMEIVIAPTPDKLKGHAMIFYKKVCGDKAEPVLRLGDNVKAFEGGFMKDQQVFVDEYDVRKHQPLPKWGPQVIGRLESLADNNRAAAEALNALQAYSQHRQAELIPELAFAKAAEWKIEVSPTLNLDLELYSGVGSSYESQFILN